MKLPITAALALLLPTQDARIVFDVASVKPAAVPAEMIGPGGSIMDYRAQGIQRLHAAQYRRPRIRRSRPDSLPGD
jgi:hypothetical protein